MLLALLALFSLQALKSKNSLLPISCCKTFGRVGREMFLFCNRKMAIPVFFLCVCTLQPFCPKILYDMEEFM